MLTVSDNSGIKRDCFHHLPLPHPPSTPMIGEEESADLNAMLNCFCVFFTVATETAIRSHVELVVDERAAETTLSIFFNVGIGIGVGFVALACESFEKRKPALPAIISRSKTLDGIYQISIRFRRMSHLECRECRMLNVVFRGWSENALNNVNNSFNVYMASPRVTDIKF